jgi:hypothetical protein
VQVQVPPQPSIDQVTPSAYWCPFQLQVGPQSQTGQDPGVTTRGGQRSGQKRPGQLIDVAPGPTPDVLVLPVTPPLLVLPPQPLTWSTP